MGEPLPDPFGYKYEDTSFSNLQSVYPSTLPSNSRASKILAESHIVITEGLKDNLLKVVGTGFVNIIRGKLLNAFGINIDIAKFTKLADKIIKNIEEFKSPEKVYVSIIEKAGKTCVAIINKGKIAGVYGEKSLVTKSDGYKSILNKAESTWVTKSSEIREGFHLSKAQELLLD